MLNYITASYQVNHRTTGGKAKMADDRMKNDERNMGGANKQNQGNYGQGQGGQQTPGRNQQDDEFSTGHRGGADQQSQQGEQKHMKDDFGTSGNKDAGQGGRNL
jgi:hypothetical protein